MENRMNVLELFEIEGSPCHSERKCRAEFIDYSILNATVPNYNGGVAFKPNRQDQRMRKNAGYWTVQKKSAASCDDIFIQYYNRTQLGYNLTPWL